MTLRALTREEVASVIEGRSIAPRVPMIVHVWVNSHEFGARQSQVEQLLSRYPCDALWIHCRTPGIFDAPLDDPRYRWVNFDDPYKGTSVGFDERVAIRDWGQLDEILKEFPNPMYPGLLPASPSDDGRYRVAAWVFCLFERHWSLRGMTNALMDYYTDPESVHRLYRALTDFYLVLIERARRELGVNAILTTDDIGTQNGPFFSPEIFRTFFKPYYKELIDKAHSLGMHFWLHTCGNIEPFLRDYIEIGLDVIHPIQKYTMDERKIADAYGRDICIWAGFDVQQTIPWGSVEDVRREVRFMMDTYWRPEGRMMITAGNAVNGDCPVASLEALLDESLSYGAVKAKPKP